MATKRTATIALFLSFNLLLSTIVSGCENCPYRPPPCPPGQYYPPTGPRPPTPQIPSPPTGLTCPRNALQLGVCADVLGGLLGLTIGSTNVEPCCSLIEGLIDLEAAICLCIAIRANILGININLPISLTLLLNVCGRNLPYGFQCPDN
ncbi:hypothetical protein Leryth_010886 [Lithospermum erythrorhizon]|nr:hypothetical protein Leryth_010886 [Lithospermum erythrorhizon]